MSSKDNNTTGPLSQSAVASFVFSSIQLTISAIIFVIAKALADLFSGFNLSNNDPEPQKLSHCLGAEECAELYGSGADGSTNPSVLSPQSSPDMGSFDQDMFFFIALSAPGILSVLLALYALSSIKINGKSGTGLAGWAAIISLPLITINLVIGLSLNQ